MTKGKKKFQPLTSRNICTIYNTLHSEGVVSFVISPESEGKIDALVANINGSNFGVKNYKTTEEKVVAYLYFLIKNHPFTDGNKRTAVLSFSILCYVNNLHEHLDGYNLDALAVFLEGVKGDDYQRVIKVVAETIFDN